MSAPSQRPFSANRDAPPPPLLPERSDAFTAGGPSVPTRAAAAPPRVGSPAHSSPPRPPSSSSGGGRRAFFDFLPPSSTSSSSSSLSRTPSVLSSSSSSRSSSSHGPPTPRLAMSSFTPPADGGESLPFHNRPYSKWECSSQAAPGLPSAPQPAAGLACSSSAGPAPLAARQTSTIRSKISSSAIALSKGSGGSASPRIGAKRDMSYLSRLAPDTGVALARGPSAAAAAAVAQAEPKIPYAVRSSDAVREMEVLLLESIRWGVLDGAYSFVRPEEGQVEPQRILDIGCGSGYWCISQAGCWRTSHFVGFDVSGGQCNLAERARSQQKGADAQRQTGRTVKPPVVDWADLSERIDWVQGNFLEMLPFDSGSFDMVRLSFLNLGVPESSWQDVLEECTRVLKKGTGVLEILEMSGDLPASLAHTPPQSPVWHASSHASSAAPRGRLPSASGGTLLAATAGGNQHSHSISALPAPSPISRKAQYDQLLGRHMIQPLPSLTIRSSLLMQTGMSRSREVFSKTYRRSAPAQPKGASDLQNAALDIAPGFVGAATGVWIESMFPTSDGSPAPVFPTLNENIAAGLLSDLAASGYEWAQPGRFPARLGAARKHKRRSLMPRTPTQRPEYDLGTLSFHAWVGTKGAGGRA